MHDVLKLREEIRNHKSLMEYRKVHESRTYHESGRDTYDRKRLAEMESQLESFNRKYQLNG